MRLVTKKKILTKNNIARKEQIGDNKCQFCNELESIDHVMVYCHFIRKISFWMGLCQEHFIDWNTADDIINFACSLNKPDSRAF